MEDSRKRGSGPQLLSQTVALLLVLGTAGLAQVTSYAARAPIDQYRMEKVAEIELARSAAPASISRDAEVLVLADNGVETAVKGKNGFVCLVARSWAAGVDDPEFWNPKVRAPICLNAAAARSYLPHLRKKSEWALAGLSKVQISEKLKAAFDNKELTPPEPGSRTPRGLSWPYWPLAWKESRPSSRQQSAIAAPPRVAASSSGCGNT